MNLLDAIRPKPGITSVIGAGGKSTLLHELAQEIRGHGPYPGERRATVVLATSTHFLAYEDIELVTQPSEKLVALALGEGGIASVGTPVCTGHKDTGKLTTPSVPWERLARLASHVLVEADGSKRLPLKAHDSHEPVIVAQSRQVIAVMGASGLGRPVEQAVHRPQLFCERVGCTLHQAATPQLVGALIAQEFKLGIARPDILVVNQVEDEDKLAQALELAESIQQAGITLPVLAGTIAGHDLSQIA